MNAKNLYSCEECGMVRYLPPEKRSNLVTETTAKLTDVSTEKEVFMQCPVCKEPRLFTNLDPAGDMIVTDVDKIAKGFSNISSKTIASGLLGAAAGFAAHHLLEGKK